MHRTLPLVACLVLLDCTARAPSEAPTRLAQGPGAPAAGTAAPLSPVAARRTPGSAAAPAEEATVEPGAEAPPGAFVTWSAKDETVFTSWIEAAPGGHRVLERRPGRWIEVDGSEWEIRVEPVTLALPSCNDLLSGTRTDPLHPGRGERVVAERVLPDGAGDRREQVVIAEPRTDATSVENSVVGVHLLGDLLLVETDTWLDACGAFPAELHDTVAFRLSTWEPVDLDATRRSSLREVLATARATLGAPSEPTHLGVGAIRPRLQPDGRILAEYVVTVTPSPESLEPWAENVGQLTVTSERLPEAWALGAGAPPAVASFARAAASARILGFARTRSPLQLDA